jgi:hypothetical protein
LHRSRVWLVCNTASLPVVIEYFRKKIKSQLSRAEGSKVQGQSPTFSLHPLRDFSYQIRAHTIVTGASLLWSSCHSVGYGRGSSFAIGTSSAHWRVIISRLTAGVVGVVGHAIIGEVARLSIASSSNRSTVGIICHGVERKAVWSPHVLPTSFFLLDVVVGSR